jgi:hypothetical protein
MVPSISNYLGVNNFWPAARTMKVMVNRSSKLISWVADHMLLSHQVWGWSDNSCSKNKDFVDTLLWPSNGLDLDFGMMTSMTWLSLMDNYTIYVMGLTFNFDIGMVTLITWLSLMDNYTCTRDVRLVKRGKCWTKMIIYIKTKHTE